MSKRALSVGANECLKVLAEAVEQKRPDKSMQIRVMAADALLRFKAHQDQMAFAVGTRQPRIVTPTNVIQS